MMKRDLNRLGDSVFDVVVIGGGINGACIAWDAVLRGLSVALVEKGDFGAATSANSLKIIHGGLRYLQGLDLARMRKSIRERSILMRLAPHLVHPMPFMVPTYGDIKNSRALLLTALKISDWVGFDRDAWTGGAATIPPGRLVSRREVLQELPHIEPRGLTGGAVWYDGFVHNSERLTLAFLRSAVEKGAVAVNYAEALGSRVDGGGVSCMRVRDRLGGGVMEVRGRVLVNAAGPWGQEVIRRLSPGALGSQCSITGVMALNVIVGKPLTRRAFGVRARPGSSSDPIMGSGRYLFMVPWRGRTMIGTSYPRLVSSPDQGVMQRDVSDFVEEFRRACPTVDLDVSDITFVHKGVLPLNHGGCGTPRVAGHPVVIDHGVLSGDWNLISVVGVKYTTARALAEDVVDLVFAKLGFCRAPACSTHQTPLAQDPPLVFGADPVHPTMEAFAAGSFHHDEGAMLQAGPSAPFFPLRAGLGTGDPAREGDFFHWGEVLRAVRHEMAVTLSDVVLRRTDLGSAGCPGTDVLSTVADIMAREHGWSGERRRRELHDLLKFYESMGVRV